MKLLLILSCVMITNAGVTKRDDSCGGPLIDEVLYFEETLVTGLDRPYLLSTDYTANTIYFSYTVYENDTVKVYKSAKIDLNTKEFTDIDVTNGFAQCVSDKGDVYIGAGDGVYKYNKVNNTAEIYSAKGVDIGTVFFKDVLYFTDYANVYTVVDGKATKFKDIEGRGVRHFTIDNDDNMFYANKSGLFRQKKGFKDAMYFKGTKNMSIRGVATDLDGRVYVALEDGIYVVDKFTNDLKMHFKVDYVFGVTFDDKNNIVYANYFAVYKLRPVRYEDCT